MKSKCQVKWQLPKLTNLLLESWSKFFILVLQKTSKRLKDKFDDNNFTFIRFSCLVLHWIPSVQHNVKPFSQHLFECAPVSFSSDLHPYLFSSKISIVSPIFGLDPKSQNVSKYELIQLSFKLLNESSYIPTFSFGEGSGSASSVFGLVLPPQSPAMNTHSAQMPTTLMCVWSSLKCICTEHAFEWFIHAVRRYG